LNEDLWQKEKRKRKKETKKKEQPKKNKKKEKQKHATKCNVPKTNPSARHQKPPSQQ